jgi:protein involved in polysaccharide export with SLBB domain
MRNTLLNHCFYWRQAIVPGLCFSILMLSVPLHAEDDRDDSEEASSSSTLAATQGSPVFHANEGIVIQVPLDTASILNGSYPIDSAGYVKLPVLGRLFIHGKTVGEVESYLGKRMSSYLKDINITTTPAIRLTLIGYWQKPGMLYADPETSVWEACRLVGGPAGERNLDQWTVRRGSSILGISLLDEFSKGSSLRAAGIKSGDIFVIPVPNPQSGFWYWFRESLTVTAEIAGIAGTVLTAYITYLILDRGLYSNNKTNTPVVP